jgi:Ca2+-transporting ATPase
MTSSSDLPPADPDDSRLRDLPGRQVDAHAHPVESVTEALNTRLDQGLDDAEAVARLRVFGANELREAPRPTFLKMLFDQFNNFVVQILIVASVVSALLGDWVEAVAIMAIVILNAVLGVVQERKAEEALAALRRMAAPEAHVLRGGLRKTVAGRETVPGDIVYLDAGNYVPADVRLVETVNLKVDEASLTGESLPVEKRAELVLQREIPIGDRHNTAYMGTLVSYGRGKGVVVATGMQTELGLIAEMIASYDEEPTPLQRRLDQLGKQLSVAALAVCALVFVIAVLGTDMSLLFSDGPGAYVVGHSEELVDFFLIAVSLAIAAVPEGLPAVVTITLALGMGEMIKRHALIRKLPAVETLGSATTIASDKTGTLTQNEMMVTALWVDGESHAVSGQGYQPSGQFRAGDGQLSAPAERPAVNLLLHAALLVNDAELQESGTTGSETTYRVVGDPTEAALVVAAAKAGLWRGAVEQGLPRVAEAPFDSDRKRMSTVHALRALPPGLEDLNLGEPYVVFAKGAADIVLERCTHLVTAGRIAPLTDEARARILAENAAMARRALRVLGCAYRPLHELPREPTPDAFENDLIFIGLVGMRDPARPEVRPAIAKARRAGLRTVMVTGDYPDTARAIAEEIGLLRAGADVLTGRELDGLSDAELVQAVGRADVFARVSPAHKVRIVEALKSANQIVAMTGDGVNDAPALKRANIGVAMGITGTDVSKQTADMVLTDDNYVSIVAAIEQGRIIYSNIRKFVYYLLSCNVAEICIIFFATLLGYPSPLTAIQLLWLNLLTDGAPALALGMEKGDPDVMERPPRPVNEPVINRPMLVQIAVLTVVLTAVVFVAYFRGYPDVPLAETMAFVTLALAELPIAYTARSERYALWRLGPFGNRYMQYAVGLSLVLLIAVIYVPLLQEPFNTVPLGLSEWALILPLAFLPALAAELTKLWLRRTRLA